MTIINLTPTEQVLILDAVECYRRELIMSGSVNAPLATKVRDGLKKAFGITETGWEGIGAMTINYPPPLGVLREAGESDEYRHVDESSIIVTNLRQHSVNKTWYWSGVRTTDGEVYESFVFDGDYELIECENIPTSKELMEAMQ